MATEMKRFTFTQVVFNVTMTCAFFPVLILGLAGDLEWVEGWLFAMWTIAMILSSLIYLYRYDPSLLVERAKGPGGDNQQEWDKYLMASIYFMAIGWYVVMPLDAKRFDWSPAFPLGWKVLGGLALLPALYFIYKATTENTFLSTRVRIQAERKQRVISTGVYRFVRHPLYLGCLLMLLGAPLLLGSRVGLAISFFAVIILMVRIIGEEKLLMDELEGYTAYQQKVKYRLIPWIW